jgi:hypothetical protein
VVAVGMLLLALGMSGAGVQAQDDVIRIGMTNSFSGGLAQAASPVWRGVMVWQDWVNAQGGIMVKDKNKKMPVKVIYVRSSRALRASDLRLRENGVEQTIRDVRQERPPAHFAFIVDRSLSMGGGKLDAALRAVQDATKMLRAGDTSSVVFFNHIVSKPQPIARGSRDFVPSGGTSLRDAVASIASKERTYAVVITDGGDRNSALTEEQALRRISNTRTVVNAIVLGDSHTRFLDRAASNTGGGVTSASKDNVGRELSRILTDINSRYLVIYQSQGTQRGWRSIELKTRRNGVTIVSARKGYFAE